MKRSFKKRLAAMVMAISMVCMLMPGNFVFAAEEVQISVVSATAQHSENGKTAFDMLDGNNDTWWGTYNAPSNGNRTPATSWVRMDLGKVYDLSKIEIKFQNSGRWYQYDFWTKISESDEYTLLTDMSTNTTAMDTKVHEYTSPTYARYIEFNALGFKQTSFAIREMKFYGVEVASVDVTATYKCGDEIVRTESGNYAPGLSEGVTFPGGYFSFDGSNKMYYAENESYTLTESGEIAVTEVTNNVGTGYEVGAKYPQDGKMYEIVSGNLIPNGDFTCGFAGWKDGTGAEPTTFTNNNDGTVTATVNGGGASNGALHRSWAIEEGKTYLFTYYDDCNRAATNIQYAGLLLSNTVGANNTGATQILKPTAADAGVINHIFTNDGAYSYAKTWIRWCGGTTIGNFGLYEVEEAVVTEAEKIASISLPESITMIGKATLPLTAKVTGTLANEAEGSIVWNEFSESGTVTGTLTVQFGEDEPIVQEVSVEVVILPETFALNDMNSVNGQSAAKANQMEFPVSLDSEFNVEFTASVASLGDLFVTMKTKDAGFFGKDQIILGINPSAAIRPVNGNGTGGRVHNDVDQAYVTLNTQYRYFVTTNPATDKYSVKVYDALTGILLVDVKDYGYRTNADVIECITVFTNNGAGSATISDVKVNVPGLENTDYTVTFVINGVSEEPTVVKALTAEHALTKVTIPEGYDINTTVEGTNITINLTSTYEAKVTFVNSSDVEVYSETKTVANGDTFTVEAKEVFVLDGDFNGKLYYIPETVVASTNQVEVVSEVTNKYVALEDALTSTNEIWGIKTTNENGVWVAAGADNNRAPLKDANGDNTYDHNHSPSTLAKSRVGFVQFPVIDVAEGQGVKAVFPIRSMHQNGYSNNNETLRFALTAINDDSWTNLSDGGTYDSANAPVFEGWSTPVFSEVVNKSVCVGAASGGGVFTTSEDAVMEFDVTEIMLAAKGAGLSTITFRLNAPFGAAYIVEREAAVVGGKYPGRVSYLTVEDTSLVKVESAGVATLTKNGSVMNGVAYVTATDDVRLNSEDAIVVNTDNGYVKANTAMSVSEAKIFNNTVPAMLGLEMINGAQVRIGGTQLGEDEKMDALADSGIRFIATANYTDTVLSDVEVEFGIKVTAEGSENVVYIPAVNFQDDNNTVFTAAITKLATNNYNRKYTATAYAKVPMADGSTEEFTAGSVTRSIYQVSAGIMKNGNADGQDAPYTVEGTVKNILNAYVNQVGIRLLYNNGEMSVSDKYTGDVFFDVTQEAIDGGVRVTITPDTTWGTPVEIASWWNEYIRVNNNNSVASTYMSNATIENGVLSFDFVVPTIE